jgi:SAM-dependent methyltransferase
MTDKPDSHVIPAYSLTALLYDQIIGRFVFEQWLENFERLEKRYRLDLSSCADVACGTGLASRYLANRKSEVFAFDRSREMLREAMERSNGLVRIQRQDMRYLLPPSKVSLLICASDSLNHLLNENDVISTIRAFFAALKPGGHAIFDMNTIWQLREGRDDKPWDFEVDKLPVRWLSKWNEKNLTATLRFIFPSIVNNRGETLEEIHRERAYSGDWILHELKKAGFQGVEVLDAAGLGKIGDHTRRFQFVAQK